MDTTAAPTLFACLNREVWLVTAQAEPAARPEPRPGNRAARPRRSGLIATFVGEASIVPDLPRVLVGLAKQHYTRELIEASGAFALHLLGERNLDWVWHFGLQSGRDTDKFTGMRVRQGPTGSPLLDEAIGWLDCRVETRMDTGDRTVYLAEVLQGQVTHFASPLTNRRLLELAPHHCLAEMKRQRHFDSHLDAEAIHNWRQFNGRPSEAKG